MDEGHIDPRCDGSDACLHCKIVDLNVDIYALKKQIERVEKALDEFAVSITTKGGVSMVVIRVTDVLDAIRGDDG